MFKWLAVVMLSVFMVGCASRVDYNRKSIDLAIGMNKSEVRAVMGEPRRTDVNEERERWIFWNSAIIGFTPIDNETLSQDRLVVTFVEGKVTRWGNQTYMDDAAEISRRTMESSMTLIKETQKTAQ